MVLRQACESVVTTASDCGQPGWQNLATLSYDGGGGESAGGGRSGDGGDGGDGGGDGVWPVHSTKTSVRKRHLFGLFRSDFDG